MPNIIVNINDPISNTARSYKRKHTNLQVKQTIKRQRIGIKACKIPIVCNMAGYLQTIKGKKRAAPPMLYCLLCDKAGDDYVDQRPIGAIA